MLQPIETAANEPCRAFISPCAAENGKLPLPLSRRLFEHVTETFDISPTFLTVLNSGVARYISPSTRSEIGKEWGQARKSLKDKTDLADMSKQQNLLFSRIDRTRAAPSRSHSISKLARYEP